MRSELEAISYKQDPALEHFQMELERLEEERGKALAAMRAAGDAKNVPQLRFEVARWRFAADADLQAFKDLAASIAEEKKAADAELARIRKASDFVALREFLKAWPFPHDHLYMEALKELREHEEAFLNFKARVETAIANQDVEALRYELGV